jgi:hypothetical protein
VRLTRSKLIPDENLFVFVEGVNHYIENLLGLGLKFMFGRFISHNLKKILQNIEFFVVFKREVF